MIEKSNYDSQICVCTKLDHIRKHSIKKSYLKMQYLKSSEDLASKDAYGDLGLSSGDAFPEEFENAILTMKLNSISSNH